MIAFVQGNGNIVSVKNYLFNDNSVNRITPSLFNPSKSISYRLKDKGFVKLMVYDAKGALNLIK